MVHYIFNIGQPANSAWWQENLDRGVITAGFDGEAGDRGDRVLQDMKEGDWVLAYCNGRGFVGAGVVGPADSYLLRGSHLDGSLSDHQLERAVQWIYSVSDVSDAVTTAEAKRRAPRQTKEQERDGTTAENIIALLSARSAKSASDAGTETTEAKYWHVLEAVRAMGRPCSIAEIRNWLELHYPGEKNSDARENACLLTVNDVNRRHYDRARRNFRSDQCNRKDALYREGTGAERNVTFQVYHPLAHGIWDVRETSDGTYQVGRVVDVSKLQIELAEARQLVAAESVPPVTSDADLRVRELRAVVLREGQGEFRAALLDAYENRCAITDCAVIELLEAAHITPYRGPQTCRTDNGLLLRADIHTLFDKGLLWLEDDLSVKIAKQLRGSEYSSLNERRLRLPDDPACRPHVEHVARHRRAATGDGDECRSVESPASVR